MRIAFTATLRSADQAPADASAPVAALQPDTQERPRTAPALNLPRTTAATAAAATLPATRPQADADTSAPADLATRGAAAPSREKPSTGDKANWHDQSEEHATAPAPPVSQAAAPAVRTWPVADVRPADASQPPSQPTEADAPAPAPRPAADPAAELPKPAAPHDIRVQVGGDGSPRVELRVTERAGDVHVAVRTPDQRLARDLREDLPALASRLEQSGYRSETWHPASAGERHRQQDLQSGAAPETQNQSRQNGRRQPQDQQEEKQKGPQNGGRPSPSKEPGKDFAWLLSSIR